MKTQDPFERLKYEDHEFKASLEKPCLKTQHNKTKQNNHKTQHHAFYKKQTFNIKKQMD
jgi:hypothetical protein